jgi:hypothetical protein
MIEGRERDLFTLDMALYVWGSPGRKPSARTSLARSFITYDDRWRWRRGINGREGRHVAAHGNFEKNATL